MKDLGKAHYILGIEIIQDPKTQKMFLRQHHKIEDILKQFKLEDIKLAKTPMEAKLELPVVKQTPSECSSLPYQALVGALNYLAHATHPDIAYAVNYLSHFNNSYDKRHWKAAKLVLCYLGTTKDYCICYDGQPIKGLHCIQPIGFCNANWGNISENPKSTTSLIFCATVPSPGSQSGRTVQLFF